ncbi:hypothetical protein SUDANB140_00804 [Streptomyces sp. enrichment culture]
MARYAATRRGISGPGTGGLYTYYVTADSDAEAITKSATKAQRAHHRLNRGGTVLDPTPTDITRK